MLTFDLVSFEHTETVVQVNTLASVMHQYRLATIKGKQKELDNLMFYWISNTLV